MPAPAAPPNAPPNAPRSRAASLALTACLGLCACGSGETGSSAPASDLALDAPPVLPAFAGESVVLDVIVAHAGPAAPEREFRVDVDVPEGVAVEAAVAVSESSDGGLGTPCEIGARVACGPLALESGNATAVRLTLRPTDGAAATLEVALVSDGTGLDPVMDRASVRLEPRERMDALQPLIDAAEPDATVTLPPGTYAGTLDGRNKRLALVGADAGATVLESLSSEPVIVNTGPESVLSGLTLRGVGGYVADDFGANLTIRDGAIVPVPGLPHALSDGLVGWESHSSSYRLEGNRIEGWGGGDGTCAHVVNGTGHSNRVYLRSNLFAGNACDALVHVATKRFSRFHHDDSDVVATNNTFDNADTGVLFDYDIDLLDARLAFENNLVLGGASVLRVDDADPRAGTDRLFVRSASNLIVGADGAGAALGSIDGVAMETVAPDLRGQPGLRDRAAGDYTPVPGSALVDAGSEPTAYRWHSNWRPCDAAGCAVENGPGGANDDRERYPQPEPSAVPAPADGDGDGAARHDVGAFELKP